MKYRVLLSLVVGLGIPSHGSSQDNDVANNYRIEPLEISERLLRLSKDAIDLSSLTFQSDIDVAEAGFEYYRFLKDEPEQAIVAAVNGYCFVAFRGSIASVGDWYQNLQPGMTPVCANTNEQNVTNCCDVRSGFRAAYDSSIRPELEASLQECIAEHASCSNDDDDVEEESGNSCVVFTGFSSGGAIAHVASLYHADLNPLLITFGQPPTVRKGCDLFPTDRIFRWVNTFDNFLGQGMYAYDIVASASFYSQASQVGHMLVLPPENSVGVAYFGLDPDDEVWQAKPGSLFAHPHENVIWNPTFRPGYRERLTFLIMNIGEYPLVANGFTKGLLCAKDYECKSGRCEKQFFAPKVCL